MGCSSRNFLRGKLRFCFQSTRVLLFVPCAVSRVGYASWLLLCFFVMFWRSVRFEHYRMLMPKGRAIAPASVKAVSPTPSQTQVRVHRVCVYIYEPTPFSYGSLHHHLASSCQKGLCCMVNKFKFLFLAWLIFLNFVSLVLFCLEDVYHFRLSRALLYVRAVIAWVWVLCVGLFSCWQWCVVAACDRPSVCGSCHIFFDMAFESGLIVWCDWWTSLVPFSSVGFTAWFVDL